MNKKNNGCQASPAILMSTNADTLREPAYCSKISEDTTNNAIDLLVTMVIDELSCDLHIEPTKLLPQFVSSITGRLLYDKESRLWWSGPSDIAEMYKKETTDSTLRELSL